MNKKFLFALPLTGMLLVSCGKVKTTLPKGYKAITLLEERKEEGSKNSLDLFGEKVAKMFGNSYAAALNDGFKASFTVNVPSFSYEFTDVDAGKLVDSEKITVEKLSFTVDLAAANLSEKVNDWQVALGIHDLSGEVSVDVKDFIKFDTKFKGIDIDTYLKDDCFYLDLSDKQLVKYAKSIIGDVCQGIVTPKEETKDVKPKVDFAKLEKNLQAVVDLVEGKYYIEDFAKLVGADLEPEEPEEGQPVVDPDFKLPADLYGVYDSEKGEWTKEGLTSYEEADIASLFVELVEICATKGTEEEPSFLGDQLLNAFTLGEYKNGRIGIQADAEVEFKNVPILVSILGLEEGDSGNVALHGYVLSDKDLRLSETAGTIELNSHSVATFGEGEEKEVETTDIKAEASATLTVDYGNKKVSVPSAKDYQLLPVYLVMTVLN